MFGKSSKPSKGPSKPSKPSKGTSKSSGGSSSMQSKPSVGSSGSTRDNGMRLEPKGVYIALWNQGAPGVYHWALVIGLTDKSGLLFHQTLSSSNWVLDVRERNLTTSRNLLAYLKIGVIEDTTPPWINMVKECISRVRVTRYQQFTCRTWALHAVYDVAAAGLIGLWADWETIDGIEDEAKQLAGGAQEGITRLVHRSRYSMP